MVHQYQKSWVLDSKTYGIWGINDLWVIQAYSLGTNLVD